MKFKITVSPGFVLLWTAIYFFGTEELLLSLMLSVMVHELSHIVMLKCVGGKVEGLNFHAAGLEIVCQTQLLSYRREFISAAAGPLGSLLLAVIAARFEAYTLAGVSLTLGLYNLLPVKILDGGKMLYCIAARFTDWELAEKTVFVSSMVTILALGIVGVWLRRWVFVYFAVILGICCCKNGANGVKLKVNRTERYTS